MRLAEVLSAERLAELVAPFAASATRMAVEDEVGRVLAVAGPTSDTSDAAGGALSVTIRGARGATVGRIVASHWDPATEPAVRGAAESIAVAIGMLVDAAARTARRAGERAERELEHRREHDRIEAELALSRRLQRSFVPLVAPEVGGWELASHYEPAREIGGDFFDAFRLRDRRRSLGLVIADVTGKGIAAALLMAFTRPLLRAAVDRFHAPAEALERTNHILVEERHSALFITALIAVVDVRSGGIRVAAAGHEPPLIMRAGSGALEWLPARGPLLGAFGTLNVAERVDALYHGDVLLCYTDGVTDARSPTGERFGERRLRAAARAGRDSSARDVVNRIVDSMQRFQAGTAAADDVTLLAVRRLPARGRARMG